MLVAPLIGEFLLGNIPLGGLDGLAVYPVLAMLYECGAVLIREIARRRGRGYPTIFVLALGYGILEEGVVTMSLFNPTYVGLELQDYGAVPALGMSLPWTLFVLTIHSVWSIVVPIALVEALFWRRRHDRWLNTPGVVSLVVLHLIGFAALRLGTIDAEQFVAQPVQLAGAALAAGLAVTAALRIRRRSSAPATSGPPWPPAALAVHALVSGSAFVGLYELGMTYRLIPAWIEVLAAGLVVLATVVVAGRQARRTGWAGRHHLALVTGALLTYTWFGWLV